MNIIKSKFINNVLISKPGMGKTNLYRCIRKPFLEKFVKKNKLYVQYKKIDPEMVSYYEPEEPIIFKNQKFLLLESNIGDFFNNIVQYCALYPATLGSGYKFLTCLLNFKILGTLIWGGLFTAIAKLTLGFSQNKFFMVQQIYLLEDGKTVEIITQADKFKADIADMRKVTPEEALSYAYLLGGNDFIPFVIKDEILVMSRDSTIIDKPLFSAISSGNYIKLTGDKTFGKDDTIDI
jgi:hypothetical protein